MKIRLFDRCPDNPVISPLDMPFQAAAVLNPGATQHGDEVLLLLRVEDHAGCSSLHVARSKNGVDGWSIESEPLLRYGEPDWRYFKGVERIGLIFSPNNKDAVLFPKKFGKRWGVLHRPDAGGIEHIWSAYSPDLVHWGEPHCVLPELAGPAWDGVKVGAGPPPILTEHGWLLIYHGVKGYGGHLVYRAGVALLDKDKPHKAIARSRNWIFQAEAPYELSGLTPNVVFPTGLLLRGDELWMYYGAADSCTCLATAQLDEVLASVVA
jgi:predicted GH43/DUF377 family glycosyl hydrolase